MSRVSRIEVVGYFDALATLIKLSCPIKSIERYARKYMLDCAQHLYKYELILFINRREVETAAPLSGRSPNNLVPNDLAS